jgi:predicted ArsR family transcriptional regulator
VTNWVETLTGETRSRLLAMLRRFPRTIADLVALSRDGIVRDVGTEKDTGGKPARVYDLTAAGEDLFPKAYAVVLAEVLAEVSRRDGPDHAIAVLKAVGDRVGSSVQGGTDIESRVRAAAEALRGLGGDVDVVADGNGWRLRGYACPLSSVASEHAQVCALAQALVARITGRPVDECCDRTGRPRCGFRILDAKPARREHPKKA